MPGLRGSNRVPGGDARTRRNWNATAMSFDDRSLGDGLGLNINRLLTVDLTTNDGLEFTSGSLGIKLPADGGLKTGASGLEVDMAGMAALSNPEDADLILIEDVTGDAKKKITIAELRVELGEAATVVTKTTTYTILTTDRFIICNSASAFTVTLPTAVGNTGLVLDIKNKGTGIITVDGAGSEKIETELNQTLGKGDDITIFSDNVEWWII